MNVPLICAWHILLHYTFASVIRDTRACYRYLHALSVRHNEYSSYHQHLWFAHVNVLCWNVCLSPAWRSVPCGILYVVCLCLAYEDVQAITLRLVKGTPKCPVGYAPVSAYGELTALIYTFITFTWRCIRLPDGFNKITNFVNVIILKWVNAKYVIYFISCQHSFLLSLLITLYKLLYVNNLIEIDVHKVVSIRFACSCEIRLELLLDEIC